MEKSNEIISRRKFFKKAAGAVLPTLALVILPGLLTSCEIDEPDMGGVETGCGSSCKGKCKATCSGLCTRSCASTCKAQAYNQTGCNGTSCKGHCYSSCKSTCSHTSK